MSQLQHIATLLTIPSFPVFRWNKVSYIYDHICMCVCLYMHVCSYVTSYLFTHTNTHKHGWIYILALINVMLWLSYQYRQQLLIPGAHMVS